MLCNLQLSNRVIIFNKTEGVCYICGEKLELKRFTIDHVIPISKGGLNVLSNKMPAHRDCNSIKDDLILGLDITLPELKELIVQKRKQREFKKLKWEYNAGRRNGVIMETNFKQWVKCRKNTNEAEV